MKIGYIRQSKNGQSVADQRAALRRSGIEDDDQVYIDELPRRRKGAITVDDLPMRAEVIRCIRAGDVLVVASLDRLGLMTADILTAVEDVGKRRGEVMDAEAGETYRWHPDATPLVAAAARAERKLMQERMRKARSVAADAGVTGGRPSADPTKLEKARGYWGNREMSVSVIAKLVGLSPRTLHKHLGARAEPQETKPPGRTVRSRK